MTLNQPKLFWFCSLLTLKYSALESFFTAVIVLQLYSLQTHPSLAVRAQEYGSINNFTVWGFPPGMLWAGLPLTHLLGFIAWIWSLHQDDKYHHPKLCSE